MTATRYPRGLSIRAIVWTLIFEFNRVYGKTAERDNDDQKVVEVIFSPRRGIVLASITV